MDHYDVTIIGAGVSGLTCARHLLAGGLSVKILEARARYGGRAYSYPLESVPHPPELGAEFIHGAPKELMQLFDELDLSFVDAADNHFFLKNKKLIKKDNFWQDFENIAKKLDRKRKKDRSVSAFLKAHRKGIPQDSLKLFKAYIEGFQAADMELMGEKTLAENEQSEEQSIGGRELFRPFGGYGRFLSRFIESSPQLRSALSLKSVVQQVRWSPQSVETDFVESATTRTIHSRCVVVTVPVGVLRSGHKASTIQFEPAVPPLKKALGYLESGYVHRLTLHFRSRFWESLHKESISFLHTGPEDFFPTWWTQVPARSPLLIAWQGGPKALELSQRTEAQRISEALKTLQKLTGKSLSFLKKQLLASYTHDWNTDPFSLGAYSYTGIQDIDHIRGLRRPYKNTIVFAGEATAEGTAQGTIHGALASGARAGRQVLKILS